MLQTMWVSVVLVTSVRKELPSLTPRPDVLTTQLLPATWVCVLRVTSVLEEPTLLRPVQLANSPRLGESELPLSV